MAIDTRAKRSAAAHVKRPGKGVTPVTPATVLWRAAVAWSYRAFLTPVGGGEGAEDKFTLGSIEAVSVTVQPTIGGRWSW